MDRFTMQDMVQLHNYFKGLDTQKAKEITDKLEELIHGVVTTTKILKAT